MCCRPRYLSGPAMCYKLGVDQFYEESEWYRYIVALTRQSSQTLGSGERSKHVVGLAVTPQPPAETQGSVTLFFRITVI